MSKGLGRGKYDCQVPLETTLGPKPDDGKSVAARTNLDWHKANSSQAVGRL